jgi:hypothetical protein
MTGIKDSNFPAFNYYEALFTEQGHVPLNPASKPPATAGIPYKHCIDVDLALLRGSDAIFLMKGWENSRGAKFELQYAEILELNVFHENDFDLIAIANLGSPKGTKEEERIYPCAECGLLRTKAEGGTTFTVCDDCWENRFNRQKTEKPVSLSHRDTE